MAAFPAAKEAPHQCVSSHSAQVPLRDRGREAGAPRRCTLASTPLTQGEAAAEPHSPVPPWASAYPVAACNMPPWPLLMQVEVAAELSARKAFLQGCDSHGRPVLVIQAAHHDMRVSRAEQTKRFICYVLDNTAAAARNEVGQFLCLFDLAGGQVGGRAGERGV